MTAVASLALLAIVLPPAGARPGTLHPSIGFAGQGFVQTDAGGGETALAVGRGPADRITVMAVSQPVPGDPALDLVAVRYDSGGTLDSGFGTGGVVRHNLRGGDVEHFSAGEALVLDDGATFTAGHLVAGGSAFWGILRLRPDGTRDGGFGVDGLARIPIGQDGSSSIFSLASDHGGGLYLATTEKGSFTLRHITAQGALDENFHGPGPGGGDPMRVSSMVVEPGGDVFVGGLTAEASGYTVVRRYRTDGSIHSGWSPEQVQSGSAFGWQDLALTGDGRVVAAGPWSWSSRVMVARFGADGRLDATFGSADNGASRGVVRDLHLCLCDHHHYSHAVTVDVEPTGKIVVAGLGRRPSAYCASRRPAARTRRSAPTGWPIWTSFAAGQWTSTPRPLSPAARS